jgi:hypothetical protein
MGYNPWSENKPTLRSEHAMASCSDGSIFIFGGKFYSDDARASNDDLFQLDTDTGVWTTIDMGQDVTGKGPSERFGHSMATVGQDLYVFGGETSSVIETGEWGGAEATPRCARHQSAGAGDSGRGVMLSDRALADVSL